MFFNSTFSLVKSSNPKQQTSKFKFPQKRDEIFNEFAIKLEASGLPLPEDMV